MNNQLDPIDVIRWRVKPIDIARWKVLARMIEDALDAGRITTEDVISMMTNVINEIIKDNQNPPGKSHLDYHDKVMYLMGFVRQRIKKLIEYNMNGKGNPSPKPSLPSQGFESDDKQGFRGRGRRWPRFRHGGIPSWRRPAIDYRDNYWIPPYEIPVEPNYFPGYNIVEWRPPYNNYYWPIR